MAFPTTVPSVADGDVFTETMWNTYVADNVNGLLSPPACIACQNAGTQQQLTASTDTAVTMETTETDPDGMWSDSTPTRITISLAGVYLVTGVAQLAQTVDSSEGARLEVRKNGSATTLAVSLFPEGNALFSVKGYLALSAAEYLELYARSFSSACPLSAARLAVLWVSRTS